MKLPTRGKILKAYPAQVIPISNGVIVRRGCIELKIVGKGVREALQFILEATSEKGATVQEIYDQFADDDRRAVEDLVGQLFGKGILVDSDRMEGSIEGPESSLQIFYWHFGESARAVTGKLNTRQIVILGVNYISRQLVASLHASGLENIKVVDHPLLRNLRLFDDKAQLIEEHWSRSSFPLLHYEEWINGVEESLPDCLIGISDLGSHPSLYEWNKFCVDQQMHFFPVVLKNFIGYVGPLVLPGETACFECLRARENAHLKDPDSHRLVEEASFEGQTVTGFHPSMASMLGDIAAFEMTKFYSGVIPTWNIGTLIEVDLLSTRLTARKVLKVPRCRVCSPLKTRSSSTGEKTQFSLRPPASR